MLSVYEKILSKVLKILVKLNSLTNVQMMSLNCVCSIVCVPYLHVHYITLKETI